MAQNNPGQIQEDDITAVIGRFHAWNTGQVPAELPYTPNGVSRLQPITYEEALAAHRGNQTPSREPAKAVIASEIKVDSAVKGRRSATVAGSTRGSVPHTEVASKPMSSLNAQPQAREKKVSVAVSKSVVQRRVDAGAEAIKQGRSRSRGLMAKPLAAGTARLKTDEARSVSARVQARPALKSDVAMRRKKVMTQEVATVPIAVPTFRNVFEKQVASDLAGEAENLEYIARAKPVGVNQAWTVEATGLAAGNPEHGSAKGKSIAMKLRMSPGEHAQIKAGADEAGVTLAAYMRQCTLDVRVLRELLTRTISDLKSPTAMVAKVALTAATEPLVPSAVKEPLSLMSALKKIWTRKRLGMSA